jgi:hypothetical protein
MSDLDAVVSVAIGGLLGYVAGGIYNRINGRRWSGKIK